MIDHYATRHAQKRAAERLGFAPTEDEWRDAAMAILDSLGGTARGLMVRRHPGGLETWLVPFAHVSARVVWSPDAALIITVMEAVYQRTGDTP